MWVVVPIKKEFNGCSAFGAVQPLNAKSGTTT
jgi:hypothetical protein